MWGVETSTTTAFRALMGTFIGRVRTSWDIHEQPQWELAFRPSLLLKPRTKPILLILTSRIKWVVILSRQIRIKWVGWAIRSRKCCQIPMMLIEIRITLAGKDLPRPLIMVFKATLKLMRDLQQYRPWIWSLIRALCLSKPYHRSLLTSSWKSKSLVASVMSCLAKAGLAPRWFLNLAVETWSLTQSLTKSTISNPTACFLKQIWSFTN